MNDSERAKLRRAIDYIHKDEAEGGNYSKGMDILCGLLVEPRYTKKALRCEPSVQKVVRRLSATLFDLLGQEQGALRADEDGRCASYHCGAINAYMTALMKIGDYQEPNSPPPTPPGTPREE